MTDPALSRPGRVGRTLYVAFWALTVVVALLIGWFAATRVATPPQAALPQPTPVITEVVSGSVSVEQTYGIAADWPTAPLVVNGAHGTVTSLGVELGGSSLSQGDIAYTVDLVPVVAAAGTVPAFRDLREGVRGDDVRQLQRLLVDLDRLSIEPDGVFGTTTAQAVERWNASRGVADGRSVPYGRIAFVPSLPAVLAPAEGIGIGSSISAGEFIFVGGAAAPSFTFVVLPEMVGEISEGMRVTIDAEGEEWEAEVARLESDAATGETRAVLRPSGDLSSICDDCGRVVQLGDRTVLTGALVVVPEVLGSEVPTAAIVTAADGSTHVRLEDGSNSAVTVLASARGASIVEGVEVGERILVVSGG